MEKIVISLGQVSAVIGAQWGDEGKGKIIDLLAPHFDVIARANGGANAGHTIVVAGKKHVFHLLPAGSLHEEKIIVLGSGMVIHLPTLLEEIRKLREEDGIDIVPRLKISHAAHIVFESHKQRDAELEERRQGGGIGTTLRGIGPAYADKMLRTGLRMEELLKENIDHKELREAKNILSPCITDTVPFLHDSLKKGATLLIEGAQATFLDIDHGTYPYVTSSATTVTGALHDLGLPPNALISCIGVVKAYCTRVGAGPFPTEASAEDSARLRARGAEFGATTGRPRRCGWLDLRDLRFAAAINGFSHLNLTKLDVLDEEETISIFTTTMARHAEPGLPAEALAKAGRSTSHLKEQKLPGWRESTKGITTFKKLPEKAQDYVRFIEKEVGIPVSFVGTGPGREEMLLRK